MRLPDPPNRYSQDDERERNRLLEQADAENVKQTGSATRFAVTNGAVDVAFDASTVTTAELANAVYTLMLALERGDRIVVD